jgi:hypothetical protein
MDRCQVARVIRFPLLKGEFAGTQECKKTQAARRPKELVFIAVWLSI